MKKYIITESWHNGCDNANGELYATCGNRQDAAELLLGLGHMMERTNRLGDGFPAPPAGQKVQVSWLDLEGVLTVWIGGKDSNPMGSEHRRIFRITEEKPSWDFIYDEEYPDTAGRNFTGLLSDGEHFLFWHALADDEGEIERCHIYESLCDLSLAEGELCSYPWTAENDSKVTGCLNSLGDSSDWCGEHCPLRTLEFSEQTDTRHLI